MPIPRWRRYLRFWGKNVAADVDDELRFHLEMTAAELVSRGASPDEARREAVNRFGDVAQVESWLLAHDRSRHLRQSRIEYMDALFQDVRYGIRKLWLQPAFTISVVTVLALGIGAATAMFSAVDAALLRPLPFHRDEDLVVVRDVSLPFALSERKTIAYIDDIRDPAVFSHVAAYAPGGLNLSDGPAPVRVQVGVITTNLFETLGVQPAHGRPFTAADGSSGAPGVAILSDAIWHRQFGGSDSILTRDIHLNGKAHRVVGVMPPGFRFPNEADLWIPIHLPYDWDDLVPFRQGLPAWVVARLAPGATLEAARSRVLVDVQRYATPEELRELDASELVEPLRDVLVASRRTALMVLLGATGFVLLIACTNVMNLLLSRASARRAEIALRGALGASRGRIVRQLLVESVILALVGGIAGIGVAAISLKGITALLPASLAGVASAQLDVRVLGFSLAIAVGTGIAFGLWPALGASRTNAAEVIKSAGGGSGSRTGMARRILVVTEVSLALMLAVGAGLMLRSLETLLENDPGLRPGNIATLEIAWERPAGSTPAVTRYHRMQDVLARLDAMPDVQAAAFVNELPLRGVVSMSISVFPFGQRPAPDAEPLMAQMLQVTPRYFEAMGIPILQGTTVPEGRDSVAPAVVINEELARRLWPGKRALGQLMSDPTLRGVPRTVVGVVGNVRATSLDGEFRPQMYFSLSDLGSSNVALIARGSMRPEALAVRLKDVVSEVEPLQAVYNVRPMTEVISRTLAPRRVNTILITTFGVLAVIVSALGVYGLVAYAVSQRRREIGIRMALGADPSAVMRMVMREGFLLAAVGAVLGLGGAWAMRRVVESMLYGITPSDPVAYVVAVVTLITTTIVATLIPARRATRVNPVEALRSE